MTPSTRSPTVRTRTPAPISRTTPAISRPGTKGGRGRTWYRPRSNRESAKVDPGRVHLDPDGLRFKRRTWPLLEAQDLRAAKC